MLRSADLSMKNALIVGIFILMTKWNFSWVEHGKKIYNLGARMASSVDPDETAQNDPSYLGLHCLQKIPSRSKELKGLISKCIVAS